MPTRASLRLVTSENHRTSVTMSLMPSCRRACITSAQLACAYFCGAVLLLGGRSLSTNIGMFAYAIAGSSSVAKYYSPLFDDTDGPVNNIPLGRPNEARRLSRKNLRGGREYTAEDWRPLEEGEHCCVCMTDLERPGWRLPLPLLGGRTFGNAALVRLNCAGRHIFHERCITQWLNENDGCPFCREVVVRPRPPNDYLRNLRRNCRPLPFWFCLHRTAHILMLLLQLSCSFMLLIGLIYIYGGWGAKLWALLVWMYCYGI